MVNKINVMAWPAFVEISKINIFKCVLYKIIQTTRHIYLYNIPSFMMSTYFILKKKTGLIFLFFNACNISPLPFRDVHNFMAHGSCLGYL